MLPNKKGFEILKTLKSEKIETLEAVVNFEVVIQLPGIGLLLALMSSLASMISIQRFLPLTMWKWKNYIIIINNKA